MSILIKPWWNCKARKTVTSNNGDNLKNSPFLAAIYANFKNLPFLNGNNEKSLAFSRSFVKGRRLGRVGGRRRPLRQPGRHVRPQAQAGPLRRGLDRRRADLRRPGGEKRPEQGENPHHRRRGLRGDGPEKFGRGADEVVLRIVGR